MTGNLKVFAGASNHALAKSICANLGIPLGNAAVSSFPNRETRIQIEENVRGFDAYVVQSMCAPVNNNLVELLIMVDALRRASADRITAVVPYFGYARQEKKTAGREPISAKLVANLMQVSGVSRVLTVDLHAAAIEGFFDIPVDHLRAAGLLAQALRDQGFDRSAAVGSTDAGGVARAEDFSRRMQAEDLFVTFKKRNSGDDVTPISLVGDVAGKTCIVIDDIISTGGSLLAAADLLLQNGAAAVHAAAVHADFTAKIDRLFESENIDSVLVTDTIPVEFKHPKLTVCSTARLLAEAIRRIHLHESVSALFI